MTAITVVKLDHEGREVFRYAGRVLDRGPTWVRLEAFFRRDDLDVAGLIFRQGDRFVERFYSDRWYNIFEIHDADDDHLKGWYCNVTRPAALTEHEIRAEDLALDLLVWPDGRLAVLDKDEFAALPLRDGEREAAHAALDSLRRAVQRRTPPFDAISNRVPPGSHKHPPARPDP